MNFPCAIHQQQPQHHHQSHYNSHLNPPLPPKDISQSMSLIIRQWVWGEVVSGWMEKILHFQLSYLYPDGLCILQNEIYSSHPLLLLGKLNLSCLLNGNMCTGNIYGRILCMNILWSSWMEIPVDCGGTQKEQSLLGCCWGSLKATQKLRIPINSLPSPRAAIR